MKRVQVDLLGGIGNQLFGGAFALALAGQFQDLEITLSDRLIPFGSNSSRRLQIHQLGLFTQENLHFENMSELKAKLLSKSDFFGRAWWKISQISLRNTLIKQEDVWNNSVPKADKIIFSDYFDDWAFIELALCSTAIPKYPKFQSKNDSIAKIKNLVKNQKTLTIHGRLGDYLDFPQIYKILPESYYDLSIQMIGKSIKFKDIVIFCESKEQLEATYPGIAKSATHIFDKSSEISDIDTFSLMCRASNLIAANSTFSFWAAWFSQRQGGKTIVPVRNMEIAQKDGSIYLFNLLFDMELKQFHIGRLGQKQVWVNAKREDFVRLTRVFSNN